MNPDDIAALTFDTGGTILDWHSGFRDAFAAAGARRGVERDWSALVNDLRRRSLKAMLNLGEHEPPDRNFDDAHREATEAVVREHGLDAFTTEDIHAIAREAPHRFSCWPDFPAVLPRLRERYLVCSFTILSYRLILDTARQNGLSWDAVFSCEGIGKYKLLPESYRTVAHRLQVEPGACLMVACHNWDLDAARAVGFRTAFVRRPDEWGPEGPPDPDANPACDIVVDSFPDLARALGVEV